MRSVALYCFVLALFAATAIGAPPPKQDWRFLISAQDGRWVIQRRVVLEAAPNKRTMEAQDGTLALVVLDADGGVVHRARITDPRRARVAPLPGSKAHVELSLATPLSFTIRIPALDDAKAIEIEGLGRVEIAVHP